MIEGLKKAVYLATSVICLRLLLAMPQTACVPLSCSQPLSLHKIKIYRLRTVDLDVYSTVSLRYGLRTVTSSEDLIVRWTIVATVTGCTTQPLRFFSLGRHEWLHVRTWHYACTPKIFLHIFWTSSSSLDQWTFSSHPKDTHHHWILITTQGIPRHTRGGREGQASPQLCLILRSDQRRG